MILPFSFHTIYRIELLIALIRTGLKFNHNDTNALDQQKPFKNPLACIPLALSIAYPIPTPRDEFDERPGQLSD